MRRAEEQLQHLVVAVLQGRGSGAVVLCLGEGHDGIAITTPLLFLVCSLPITPTIIRTTDFDPDQLAAVWVGTEMKIRAAR